jgi:hypothetical protein
MSRVLVSHGVRHIKPGPDQQQVLVTENQRADELGMAA